MFQPFWQQAMSGFDFAAVAEFVAEAIPEHEHVEYKGPTYNRQSHKLEITAEVLETIVAFANSGGGMLLYGVEEDKGTKRPIIDEGIIPSRAARDLEAMFRNMCASQIDPSIALETRVITIPPGQTHAGNLVLVVRVRAGRLRPYYLRDKGVYLRAGDSDRLATLRELAALFGASLPREGSADSPWSQILRNVFSREQLYKPEIAPYLMVGLNPAFPLEPVTMDETRDAEFSSLCVPLFMTSPFLVLLSRGIMHAPSLNEPTREDDSIGYAFDEGAIGVSINLSPGQRNIARDPPLRINLIYLWQTLYRLLTGAARWPRDTFAYDGPLICRIALGNITDIVAVGPDSSRRDIPAGARNKLPGWSVEREWDSSTGADDVIEEALASLARQLQFPNYQTIKKELRAAAH